MNTAPAEVADRRPLARAAQKDPAKLKRRLRGDLDNIVLKALRKEPELRYSSVEQFAEDIRRHLQGLPVTAVPDSVPYRIEKFFFRHKVGVAATTLVLLALAGGVLATVREARIAEANRRRADARFNDVRQLANSFLFEFDDAIENLPGSTPARALVVKRALEYLDKLAGEARGDRSLQLEIASAYHKVAEVQGDPMYPNLGDYQGALQSSTKSLAILEGLSREEPDNQQVRISLADAHQQVSDLLGSSSDSAGAVEHSWEALEIYEGLATSMAGDPKFHAERVAQTNHYANLLKLAGRLEEAATQYRRAVELSQEMVTGNPSDQDGKIQLATSLDGLGNVLQEMGDTSGALEHRRKGLAIREELSRLDPNNAHYRRQLAFSHHNVGLSLVEAEDIGSALANFREELSLFKSLSAADPKDVQGRRNQSLAHKQIGDVLMRTDDVRGALIHYRAALGIDREILAADPSVSQAILDLSFSESKVGSALGKLRHTPEALGYLRSGVARQESLAARDPHNVLLDNHLANSYSRLANCLQDSGDRKDAVDYYRKAVASRLKMLEKSPNSSWNRGSLAECYTNLAMALGPRGGDEVLRQYSNAIELLEPLITADRGNAAYRIALADALTSVARLYVRKAGQDHELSIRLQYWTKARLSYQRSRELWLALEKAGKLPPARSGSVQEVSTELARCSDSLAKLQPNR